MIDSLIESLVVYGGLFLLSFLAATIFPAQSEIGLVALIGAEGYSIPILIAVASVGNTLGSVVNWVLGRSIERFRHKRWFPVKEHKLDRAIAWYHKYGRWSLLMSWAPFIGDPLTVVAGILREPFWSFLAIVAVAKTVRYLVVAGLALQAL